MLSTRGRNADKQTDRKAGRAQGKQDVIYMRVKRRQTGIGIATSFFSLERARLSQTHELNETFVIEMNKTLKRLVLDSDSIDYYYTGMYNPFYFPFTLDSLL